MVSSRLSGQLVVALLWVRIELMEQTRYEQECHSTLDGDPGLSGG
jgi:hypothetical protein